MNRVIIVITVLLLAGCVHDISYDKRFQTDYVVGGTYRVLQKLAVRDLDMLALSVPRGEPPSSLGEARKQIQFFVGYVPVGTLIRLEKLELESHFEMGKLVWAKGRFIDGPFAGKKVELGFASEKSKTYPSVPQVNTNVLQLVEKP
jgi:hypothetical protein